MLRTNHENQRLGFISKQVLSSSHDLVKSVVKYNAVLSSSHDLVNSVVNRTTKGKLKFYESAYAPVQYLQKLPVLN